MKLKYLAFLVTGLSIVLVVYSVINGNISALQGWLCAAIWSYCFGIREE